MLSQSQDCFTSLFIFMFELRDEPVSVDHRLEMRLEDRMYVFERDSFDYQCQCDRFSY